MRRVDGLVPILPVPVMILYNRRHAIEPGILRSSSSPQTVPVAVDLLKIMQQYFLSTDIAPVSWNSAAINISRISGSDTSAALHISHAIYAALCWAAIDIFAISIASESDRRRFPRFIVFVS